MGSSPKGSGWKIKNMWNHHLVIYRSPPPVFPKVSDFKNLPREPKGTRKQPLLGLNTYSIHSPKLVPRHLHGILYISLAWNIMYVHIYIYKLSKTNMAYFHPSNFHLPVESRPCREGIFFSGNEDWPAFSLLFRLHNLHRKCCTKICYMFLVGGWTNPVEQY